MELQVSSQDEEEHHVAAELSKPIPLDSQPPKAIHQNSAKGRSRRVGVRPPQGFGYEDMIGYALHAAEEVDSSEPSTYKEVVSGSEAA